jgi:ATP-dependent exoDNAse (exonuclease V) beta subunit
MTLDAVKKSLAELPDKDAQVAVLVRGRSHLSSLIPALQSEGIAYQGVDIQPLAQQAAVIDLISLCKALCREDDRIAWLALLRGPWCGLSLTELNQAVGSSEATVWQQLQSVTDGMDVWSDSDSQLRVQRFVTVMQKALQQRHQIGLSSLTRWTWRALGGQDTLFGASQKDIETVFGLIEDLQRGGDIVSLSELDQAVDRLYAEPTGDNEARLIVSTMHRAKGLQFHTVILPGLSRQPRANSKEIMMWAEHLPFDAPPQLLLAPHRLEVESGSHYSYLRELDKKRAVNESVRLMYVACTRAEKKLVLISELAEHEQTGELKTPRSNTLLASIWGAAEIDFVSACNASTEATASPPIISDESELELDQTLQRLPTNYRYDPGSSVNWQPVAQLIVDGEDDDELEINYDWSTEVATAVGTVMHEWLQYNQTRIHQVEADDHLRARWRADLRALGVSAARLSYAVERLSSALQNMQNDRDIDFLFADYPEQNNELALGTKEGGSVKYYRIDRTFVDQTNTRWIVDYKTTSTRALDIDQFVDQQIEERHRAQIERYGALMSQIDQRPIKLAIYFPMLGKLRSWDYNAPIAAPQK